MRKITVPGLISLVIILFYSSDSPAYVFEIHPGLRLAYEYTDNGNGLARDPVGESIYDIGPRLDVLWNTPTMRFDLGGYVTRTHHTRFNEDDTTEANATASAAITGVRQSLDLRYSYLQTTRRETLTIPSGLTKTNTAGVSYMRMLTQFLTMNIDYGYASRREPPGGEREVSNTGRGRLSYQMTTRNSVDLSYEYDDYRYEINPDAQVMITGLAWRYLWSPRMNFGVRGNYTRNNRDLLPNEYIYSVMPNVMYSITQHTTLNLAAGKDWYVTEHQDRQSTYSMDGSVEYAALQDRATVRLTKGYQAQFTSNLYGIYETKTATVSLQKELVQTLAGIIDLSIIKTTPSFDVPENIPPGTLFNISTQEETDTMGRFTLRWDPNRYLTLSGIYEHLQHDYEISDTVHENRYRMVLEVRY